jgi:uncharacterized membrane protein YqiK
MGMVSVLIGVGLAVAIILGAAKLPSGGLRAAAGVVALLVLLAGLLFSSLRFVSNDRIGVVIKNAIGPKLPSGQIIATSGEMGPQAAILPPGWHWGVWPFVYDVESEPVTVIAPGTVGLIQAVDGRPLPPGEIYAPEWSATSFQQMLDAPFFLTQGKGFKGPQASVLTPGAYRINPKLFQVTVVPVLNIPPASVGVVKANVGDAPPTDRQGHGLLVERGQRGVWRTPLPPQEYYLNTKAFEVTVISTKVHIVEYTVSRGPANQQRLGEGGEREIQVRSADGFTFPVDVRVEYVIDTENAPLVVATLKDDQDSLSQVLNSAVRAIFRNSAERVKALDYVQQRSQQERQALEALSKEMTKYGVSVTAVRIGNIGDEQSLGVLLKTQTDREIAQQEQRTFQEQQKAAEQKKSLTRTVQEAEEEKRLATANYQVKIAEQDKTKRIIEANADAESIRIKADAQAQAFAAIAREIGPANSALLELLKIVGERGIQITPRVMVSGPGGGGGESVALIGTMLDTMTGGSATPPATEPASPKRP